MRAKFIVTITWFSVLIGTSNIYSASQELEYDLCKEKNICSSCVERFHPKLLANRNVTLDESIIGIGVQYLCAIVDRHPESANATVALCILERLKIGSRGKDFLPLFNACSAPLRNQSEPISGYFVFVPCMMEAVESGKIYDRDSGIAAQLACQSYAGPAPN